MANKKLAVVYITHRPINDEEKCLLRYSIPHLLDFDKYLVVPSGIYIQSVFQNFKIINLNPYYFNHINGYNELLMMTEFYQQFDFYENILILQPDCVVLRPGIDFFCGKSLYLGASFIKPKYVNRFWLTKYPRLGHLLSRIKIGKKIYGFNGGFSIRNIPFFIKHAPALRANSDILLYREDIVYSYIFFKQHSFNENLSDSFCLEEKFKFYQKLDQIVAYGIHDPKKYNIEIYNEILELSKVN